MIPYPTSGKKLPRTWAESVTDAANAVHQLGVADGLVREMGPLGSGAEALPANQRNRRGGVVRPLPFEVRWDSTLDSGNGNWKIYLPTSHLLFWAGDYVALGGVTAIDDTDGNPTGWYEFDDIDASASHVWLIVSETTSGSGTTVSATFANVVDQDAKANICIAEVSYTAATGQSPAVVSIKQSVVGAIIFGGGGSEITASGTAVSSVDYVTDSNDPDYASHAYAIRIKRGTLTYNAQTGALSIVEDNNLKQFIATTPHSTSMDS